MAIRFIVLLLLLFSFVIQAATPIAKAVEVIHLALSANMDRADLYYEVPTGHPRAVLVLCPGCNGSGEGLVCSQQWQEFAQRNHLGLVGLSFASPEKAIHDGDVTSVI